MKELYKALNKVKKEIGKVQKDGNNPFFKCDYLTLNGIWEAIGNKLEDNGLCLTQTVKGEELITTITHIESEKQIVSFVPLIATVDMQKLGSAITYARRYSIIVMLDIIDGENDDDGEKTMGRTKPMNKPYTNPNAPTEITEEPF